MLLKNKTDCFEGGDVFHHCCWFFSINSMPDLSIPEIVKQFNERQSQKSKQMRRPHSSAIYSTKKTTRKHDSEKPSDCSYSAFITGEQISLKKILKVLGTCTCKCKCLNLLLQCLLKYTGNVFPLIYIFLEWVVNLE